MVTSSAAPGAPDGGRSADGRAGVLHARLCEVEPYTRVDRQLIPAES